MDLAVSLSLSNWAAHTCPEWAAKLRSSHIQEKGFFVWWSLSDNQGIMASSRGEIKITQIVIQFFKSVKIIALIITAHLAKFKLFFWIVLFSQNLSAFLLAKVKKFFWRRQSGVWLGACPTDGRRSPNSVRMLYTEFQRISNALAKSGLPRIGSERVWLEKHKQFREFKLEQFENSISF